MLYNGVINENASPMAIMAGQQAPIGKRRDRVRKWRSLRDKSDNLKSKQASDLI
jgi:hypothetical protein